MYEGNKYSHLFVVLPTIYTTVFYSSWTALDVDALFSPVYTTRAWSAVIALFVISKFGDKPAMGRVIYQFLVTIPP